MSTKYGSQLSHSERWRMAGEDRPIFSQHALERWDERTPDDAPAPETAWEDALEDSWLPDHPHFNRRDNDPDRIRVYHGGGWGVVFVADRDDGGIDGTGGVRTVLRIEDIYHRGVRGYCAGLRRGDLR